mmetsp:Transcript_1249/g.4222  ORF Transcript_1249/g.4222 Transcript_1249/m.4222 type:complete len:298 (-) Transcript_1249:257-1150(-)
MLSPRGRMNKKQTVQSIGVLSTRDTLQCVGDTAFGADTNSDCSSEISAASPGPQPSEANAEAKLQELKDGVESNYDRILADLGFDEGVPEEPLLTVQNSTEGGPGSDQSPRRLNLFWRQHMKSRQPSGRLTAERLQQDAAAHPPVLCTRDEKAFPCSVGEWLVGFKTLAKEVLIGNLTAQLLGDVGTRVALFVGDDALAAASELHRVSEGPHENADLRRVVGSRLCRVPATMGGDGRAGFVIDDDVSISVPCGTSSSGSVAGGELGEGEGDPFSGAWWMVRVASTEAQRAGAFEGTL